MYRAQPVGNRICHQKELARQQKRHKDRVNSVKAAVNNKPPRRFPHLESRKKRDAQLEERYQRIERENKLLLEKMSEIMREGGAIDNDGSRLAGPSGRTKQSLHQPYRRRQLQAIVEENQRILQRIRTARPFIQRSEFDAFGERHDQLLAAICEREVVINDRVARLQSKHKKGRRKPKLSASTRGVGELEKVVIKEGVAIGDRFVVVTVLEVSQPTPTLSFRSYDVDSAEADRADATVADLAKLVNNATLMLPEKRDLLASFLLQHLTFRPNLSLPRAIDGEAVERFVSGDDLGAAAPAQAAGGEADGEAPTAASQQQQQQKQPAEEPAPAKAAAPQAAAAAAAPADDAAAAPADGAAEAGTDAPAATEGAGDAGDAGAGSTEAA